MKIPIYVSSAALLGGWLLLTSHVNANEAGAKIFQANCAACHQLDGQGIPGAFPALVGNAFLVSDVNNVTRVVLNGRGGMPAFSKDLKNEELASVIEYVRETFNGVPTDITATQVEALKTAKKPKMEREL